MLNLLFFGDNFRMGLEIYKKKRDFNKTTEPSGESRTKRKVKAKSGGEKVVKQKQERGLAKGNSEQAGKKDLIFVVQFHRARREHYDFRLEWQGVMLSWAVPKGMSFDPKEKRLAVHVEDHPIEYADFEGVIPKGQYGAGSVLIWDKGKFLPINNFDEGIKSGILKFELFGQRLVGAWALVRLKDEKNWLLIKENDKFADADHDLSVLDTSVVSGRNSKQIVQQQDLTLRGNPFSWTEVQLAKLGDKIPKGKEWVFEIKYDGYRILTYAEKGRVKFFTRNKKDFSDKFRTMANDLLKWSGARSFVLDGEMVVLDEHGRSDFQALQNHLKMRNNSPLVYMVFDLLALDGENLRGLTLVERKMRLKEFLMSSPENVVYCDHVVGHGEMVFAEVQRMGLEGIVAKLAKSQYSGGRNGDWLKFKCRKRQEFVVGGYTRSEKKINGISSLLVGVFEKEKFVFVGSVGTGFNTQEQKELVEVFDKLRIEKPVFDKPIAKQNGVEIVWVKPQIVVEVEFSETTKEGLLRQASFKGFRNDKSPTDVVFEEKFDDEEIQFAKNDEDSVKNALKTRDKKAKDKKDKYDKGKIIVEGVEISNPNKMLYDDCKVRKIDVVNFYVAVAPRMLEFIKNRILSVVRCHGKVAKGSGFYKKHPTVEKNSVKIVSIENSDGEKSDYFCVDTLQGIVSQVQLGTIEFHTWGSRVETLHQPDIMVFDLDPDEKLGIEDVRRGVKDLKKILDKLGLKSFLKTSGGKGYHIVVPFKPSVDWETFHDFAENVAKLMESKWPERYTSNMRKDCREGKIFIDWVRNGKGATSVAPYSLRARAGAKVSAPIFWSELDKIAPDGIDIFNVAKRLKKKDPWANFWEINQELK